MCLFVLVLLAGVFLLFLLLLGSSFVICVCACLFRVS